MNSRVISVLLLIVSVVVLMTISGAFFIVSETEQLLSDQASYASMAKGASPYGDGFASRRIAGILRGAFDVERKVEPMAR